MNKPMLPSVQETREHRPGPENASRQKHAMHDRDQDRHRAGTRWRRKELASDAFRNVQPGTVMLDEERETIDGVATVVDYLA